MLSLDWDDQGSGAAPEVREPELSRMERTLPRESKAGELVPVQWKVAGSERT